MWQKMLQVGSGGSGGSGAKVVSIKYRIPVDSTLMTGYNINLKADYPNWANITKDDIIIEYNSISYYVGAQNWKIAELDFAYYQDSGLITLSSTQNHIPFRYNGSETIEVTVHIVENNPSSSVDNFYLVEQGGIAKGGTRTVTINKDKNYIIVVSLNYSDTGSSNNRAEVYSVLKGNLVKVNTQYAQSQGTISGNVVSIKNTNASLSMSYMLCEVQ